MGAIGENPMGITRRQQQSVDDDAAPAPQTKHARTDGTYTLSSRIVSTSPTAISTVPGINELEDRQTKLESPFKSPSYLLENTYSIEGRPDQDYTGVGGWPDQDCAGFPEWQNQDYTGVGGWPDQGCAGFPEWKSYC
jgi:hypothetical protein